MKTYLFRTLDKKCNLYIKYVLGDHGNLYNIEHFCNRLKKKNNILCEHTMIKKCTEKDLMLLFLLFC